MKYKLLISDIDETLLNDEKQISKRNKELIREYINQGGKFALASGRVHTAMTDVILSVGVGDQKHLSNNGITAFDLNGYVNNFRFFENDAFKNILDILRKEKIEHYVNTTDSIIHPGSYNLLNVASIFNVGFNVIRDNPYNARKPYLIYALITSKESEKFMLSLKNDKIDTCVGTGFIIFMPKGSGKFDGGVHLANELGIAPDEIACIGDGGNDIEMIKKSSFGIAVKNAMDEVKNVANIILEKTNNEDAVAFAIEKYLL